MRKINTLAELKAEQKVLHYRKTFLETEIKKDISELKEDLEPLKVFTKSAGNAFPSKNNGLLGNAFGYLAEFLAKNVFLRNSGFLTRLIVPFLAKNTTSNLVEDHKPKIIDWIKNMISRFSNKKTVEE
jgi:hypothetical protein